MNIYMYISIYMYIFTHMKKYANNTVYFHACFYSGHITVHYCTYLCQTL